MVQKISERIKANKVSGAEGSLFYLSVVPEGAKQNERRNKFKLHFYGTRLDVKRHKLDEWIDDATYRHHIMKAHYLSD